MAYLGRGLDRGNYLKLDDISSQFNGSTTTFNLTSGGQPFYPGSSYSLIVSLAGIIQEPESAFAVSNNQIIFASAPATSDNFFCIVLGVPLASGTLARGTINSTHLQVGIVSESNLADGSVTTIKIADNAVTYDKLDENARGVGIQSGGISIAGAGVTQLNFVGTGNTFLYNPSTKTIDISIEGGGGPTGAGGTWNSNNVGVYTGKSAGINTTTIVGSANSEGALQVQGNVAIVEGALLTHQTLEGDIYIPSNKNGLLIGPVTVGAAATIDVAVGSVLVIV